jgi:hypothetical protein
MIKFDYNDWDNWFKKAADFLNPSSSLCWASPLENQPIPYNVSTEAL